MPSHKHFLSNVIIVDEMRIIMEKVLSNFRKTEAGFPVTNRRPIALQQTDLQIIDAENKLRTRRYTIDLDFVTIFVFCSGYI